MVGHNKIEVRSFSSENKKWLEMTMVDTKDVDNKKAIARYAIAQSKLFVYVLRIFCLD